MSHLPRINKRSLLPFLLTFVLLLSVATGVILVQQRQELSSKAQVRLSPKKLTGTFLMFDFNYDTAEGWYPFLDEIKEIGMDTIIVAGTASIGNCPDNIVVSPHFNDGTIRRFLEASKDKDIEVYLGLAWAEECVDNDEVINLSLELADTLKRLSERMGWSWEGNFIKGFYIPPEAPVDTLSGTDKWEKKVDLYKRLSASLKQLYPTKFVMISPYKLESNSYQTIYNGIRDTINDTDIDVYAVQDGVGAGLVTSFDSDRAHYQALSDAIRDGALAGENVHGWANIETFSPSQDGNQTWPPTDIDTLSWQIDATDSLVEKRITWIYQWSMAGIPLPDVPQYTDYSKQRVQLRSDYMERFVLTPTPPDDDQRMYFCRTAGWSCDLTSSNYANTPAAIEECENNLKTFLPDQTTEMCYPVEGSCSSECNAPTLTLTSTPAPQPLPGDINGDGIVNILDFQILSNAFGTSDPNPDLNGDGIVNLLDFQILSNNFGKT